MHFVPTKPGEGRALKLGEAQEEGDLEPPILSISSELQGIKWLKTHDEDYMADIKPVPPPEYTPSRARAVLAAIRIGPLREDQVRTSLLEVIIAHQDIFSLGGEEVRAVKPGGGVGTTNMGIHPPISQKAM